MEPEADPARPSDRLSPIAIGAICALAALAFVTLRVLAHDGDITSLIRVGAEVVEPDDPPAADLYLNDGIGYDGQFFYRQALDPLSTAPEVEGIPLDRPVYRSSRLLYPSVVWLASGGGQRAAVPWAMAGVNVLAIGVVGAAGASLARSLGRATSWGLAFAGWPGLVIGLAYDLAEPLEAALVLSGLATLRHGRRWPATLLLSGAALTRETSLLVPLGIVGAGLVSVLPRLSDRLGFGRRGPNPLFGLPPIGAYLAVQYWMSSRWDEGAGSGTTKSADQLDALPLSKLVRQIGEWVTEADPVGLYQLIQVVVMLLLFGFLVAALVDREAGFGHERLTIVGGLALLTTVGGWDRMVVYLRWPTITVLVGLVVFLASHSPPRPTWVEDRVAARLILFLCASTVPIWIFI